MSLRGTRYVTALTRNISLCFDYDKCRSSRFGGDALANVDGGDPIPTVLSNYTSLYRSASRTNSASIFALRHLVEAKMKR